MKATFHVHGATRRIVIDADNDQELSEIGSALTHIMPEKNVDYDLIEFGDKVVRRAQRRLVDG